MTQTTPKIAVLIVAAGVGSRMNADIPKQYSPIHGRMVLTHTLQIFSDMPEISCVQCVYSKDHDDFYQQAVNGFNTLPPVEGGATRQESVFEGLKALKGKKPDIVLIHDAARPCVKPQDIRNLINTLKDHKSATLAMQVSDTLVQNDVIVPRENAWLIQTPQGFDFDTILKAHEHALDDRFIGTDDTSLISHQKIETQYIPCGRYNLKITTQDDLKMAEKLLQPRMETRVGNGFDVHAFNDAPAQSIRLCGIDIPHNKSLKGHSDADVGLHAITDAIFGALADGDIGSHFPPSDQKFKNMDSHVFLDKSVDNLKSRGGKIIHMDITFMCEEPKIGKHREAIRDHLSNHLNLSTSRISVKATTTEKLGFTGRGEGIACQAVVTIEVPSHD